MQVKFESCLLRRRLARLALALLSLSAMVDREGSCWGLREGRQGASAPLRSDTLQPVDELCQEMGTGISSHRSLDIP